MSARMQYERDDVAFPADAYTVKGCRGVAWYVLGWQTEPDDDTGWSGCEIRTGRVCLVMIGDDHLWSMEPGEIEPLAREAYCGVCGQIGCRHDGLERAQ